MDRRTDRWKERPYFLGSDIASLREANFKRGFEYNINSEVNLSEYTYKQFDRYPTNHYKTEEAKRKPKADNSINQSQYILMLNIKLIHLSKFYFVIKTKDPNRYKKLNYQTIKK